MANGTRPPRPSGVRGKPWGAVVRLRCTFWEGTGPWPGDFIVTDAGSAYCVMHPRLSREGRGSITCQKVDPLSIPHDATVHRWEWNRRTRKVRS